MISCRDLGRLAGPVLVFGGPYSNLAATMAMRQRAEELAILPQNILCTGDVVAYCAEPEETVRLVRDWGIPVVMGNCEESLAAGAPDCGCGFGEGSACSALSTEWYRFADRQVSSESRAWMARLPRALRFELEGRTFLAVHGGVERINRFLFASDAEGLGEELQRSMSDAVIAGHCGIPFGRRIGERTWLNAGAIGMPGNDGTSDGWFMLLAPKGSGLEASWHRLPYDAAFTRRRMVDAGLQAGYAETILRGLWPSEDVLPAEEMARRGVPLNPAPLLL